MGICPRCGSWVDEGEPYCPDCCYGAGPSSAGDIVAQPDRIEVNGFDYDRRDVERALEELGYDFDDFEAGDVDEYELERKLLRGSHD